MEKGLSWAVACFLVLLVFSSCSDAKTQDEQETVAPSFEDGVTQMETDQVFTESVPEHEAEAEPEPEPEPEPVKEPVDEPLMTVEKPLMTAVQPPQIHIQYADGDSSSLVRKDIGLPNIDSLGNSLEWQSSRPEVISSAGVVQRPDFMQADVMVVLTARADRENIEVEDFALHVPRFPGIIFHANGGSGSMHPQTAVEDESVLLQGNLFSAPEGSVFAGWSRRPGGPAHYSDREDFTAGDEVETTLYAIWATDVYPVSYYNLPNASNNPENPVSYSSRSANIRLLAASRSGYRFAGWFDGPDAQAVQVTRIEQGTEDDLHLYARWIPERFSLAFDSAASDVGSPAPRTVEFDAEYGPLPELQRRGYSFQGWEHGENGMGIQANSVVQTAENHRLVAVWEAVNYTIRYRNMHDAQNAPGTPDFYTVADDQISLFPPERPSYNFDGWFDNPEYSGDRISSIPAASIGDREYYARWLYAFPGIAYRDMAIVPGGTFLQRATEGNPRQFYNRVRSFEMARYPVTYELWHSVKSWADDNGYSIGRPGREGSHGPVGREPERFPYEPVTSISWREAVVWVNAYSEMEGLIPVYYTDSSLARPLRSSNTVESLQNAPGQQDNPFVNWEATGYRLPTEGEWQFAASYRDGFDWTPNTHASGASASWTNDAASTVVAWYFDNADTGSGPKTQPVGGKEANALGIHDMSGNVWEWCWDWWLDYPETEQGDYRGGARGSHRITRGGAWRYVSSLLQVGRRDGLEPWYATSRTGLRVVRSRE